MKIRIKGNSVRFRLTRTEVEKFTNEGYLEETTDFGPSCLTYSLQRTAAGNLWASFEQNNITLFMPDWMMKEWAGTDRVGFENKENNLYILIEKDFMCLDIAPELQSDNYPHPEQAVC